MISWMGDPEAIVRFLVTSFFAVVFLQSGLDKVFDREGNLAYLRDVFKNSSLPAEMVPRLFRLLTALEVTAGVLCALGVLSGSFRREGVGIAALGVAVSGLALVGLIAGQRLAKDYAGAAVIAAYFAVALIGLGAF
jgi:putative oxidoreductase